MDNDISMKIVELNVWQIIYIYMTRMTVDFPRDERKPLHVILNSRRKKQYLCLGLEDAGEIVAYAFFVKLGDDYLFEYLATKRGRRNQNIGGNFIRLLKEYMSGAKSMIGEVEDPAYATSEEERVLRKRRYDFYMRNGLIDTGVTSTTFGVHFLILEVDIGVKHTQDEIRSLYRNAYYEVLPARIMENNLILDQDDK